MINKIIPIGVFLAGIALTLNASSVMGYGEGNYDPCYHHFAYPCDHGDNGGSNNGYAYIQPTCAADCTQPNPSELL